MPPSNQPPAPGPTPPGFYPGPPTPPPAPAVDPNTPPAWAQALIDNVAEVHRTNQALAQRFEELDDPNTQPPGPPAPAPNPDDKYAGFKPGDWPDIPRKAEEIATEVVQRELTARDQAAQEASERASAARRQADQALDAKVTELEAGGIIPKVVNAADPNDPGRLAQRELYSRALYENTDDLARVANDIKFYHEKGFKWDVQNNRWLEVNRPPAGMYAPVGSSGAGAAGGGGGGGTNKPSYQEIHGARSLTELAQRAGMQ